MENNLLKVAFTNPAKVDPTNWFCKGYDVPSNRNRSLTFRIAIVRRPSVPSCNIFIEKGIIFIGIAWCLGGGCDKHAKSFNGILPKSLGSCGRWHTESRSVSCSEWSRHHNACWWPGLVTEIALYAKLWTFFAAKIVDCRRDERQLSWCDRPQA